MVAIIKTGQSVRRIFQYNENKVALGEALCIGQGNYPADHDQLSNSLKINLLLRQLELNENVKRGSVHISLNFHPSEKDLDHEKLMNIASSYMTGIGFAEQPYLVYQHFDAGHPHIHIVSVKVGPSGKRIDMQNIGRNQSETARVKIEKDFNLIKAQGREKQINFAIQPISASKVGYGKIQSKKAVSQVLDFVLNTYQYKSLPQLNAVLNLYNVAADRGRENSRVFKGGGLVYRILDKDGKTTGVPIKASDFYNRPTLKFLEKKFEENTLKNSRPGLRIKNAIRAVFQSERPSIKELSKALEEQGITMIKRHAQNGSIYGLTYVDHVSKQVCNGSELGKEFSAAAIQQNCRKSESEIIQNIISGKISLPSPLKTLFEIQGILESKNLFTPLLQELIIKLFKREFPGSTLPSDLKRKKKKRRRKGLSNN
ncbi:Relaxase/Mobilisation nuclease domain-containing protein [Flavobacterium aquidurense]|uniref:Relaxase n=1 Tax=Flavobacterium frigidimaris TaxID=262320 RepID=A0ABX4BPU8_FLAFR|nr:relaxase/mobilization nuclease domain-containing protein [Flavobacterium frigidimaris]OXA78650.1 relaxase [Flavobacterium frigidimaris]SDZ57996.1 Relaxase/Mobilisation nuclease domain-containing protein [Flavobacterium aquidurense]